MTRRMIQQSYAALWEIPTWVFLWSGLAVIAAVLLVGPWLELREMQWQKQYIELQAQRLAQQRQAYQQMLVSLEQNDPVLVQRLAFHYLHLKPKGVQLVGHTGVESQGPMFVRVGSNMQPRFVAERSATVDQWLYQPMPVVGQDMPALSKINTTFTQLATGPQRLLVAVVGGLCILLGLIPLSRLAKRPEPVAPLPVLLSPVTPESDDMSATENLNPPVTIAVDEAVAVNDMPLSEVCEVDADVTEYSTTPIIQEKTQSSPNDTLMHGRITFPSSSTPAPLVQVAAPPPPAEPISTTC